ncbi:MAG TPA: N-acetyltransferase [Vicinamibacterales bacterium]|jgi:putative acetyltransferase
MKPGVTVRVETSLDRAAIHAVEAAAFGRDGEATLVDAVRELNEDFISLVATDDEQVVGHICFSRVTLEPHDGRFSALAPLAVLPSRQRQGIGSMLVTAGLEECRNRNVQAVFVVGDPAYYSRFGFTPARDRGVRCEFDVPDVAFRVIELRAHSVKAGVLRYPQPFHRL